MNVACKMSFDAAHILWGYAGKCGNLHGHTYKLEVVATCNEADKNKMGMVVDYNELKRVLKPLVGQYDHAFLVGSEDGKDLYETCEKLGLKIKHINGYSTTENIAHQIMGELIGLVEREHFAWYPHKITLAETDSTYASVYSWEV